MHVLALEARGRPLRLGELGCHAIISRAFGPILNTFIPVMLNLIGKIAGLYMRPHPSLLCSDIGAIIKLSKEST